MSITYMPLQIATFINGASDLKQNRFVKLTSGLLGYGTSDAKSVGVLYNDVKAGEQSTVHTYGIVMVEVGTGGTTENGVVASDATGKAIAVDTGDVANGIALETVAAGGIAKILLR